jgi:hypothetical protein
MLSELEGDINTREVQVFGPVIGNCLLDFFAFEASYRATLKR